MPGQCEGGSVEPERLAQRPAAMVDLCNSADRRQVFRRGFKNVFQLAERGVEVVHLEQRATERHASGKITGMDCEPGSAGFDRVFVAARPPVLFGELRKRNRRRVFYDPASEFFYAGIVGHGYCSIAN